MFVEHLLESRGNAAGRHGWNLQRPTAADGLAFAAIVKITGQSHLTAPISGVSKYGRPFNKYLAVGRFILPSLMGRDRLVDFFGGYLTETALAIHHADGVIQLAKLGDEPVPFLDATGATETYRPREIPNFPPATTELQPGDLAYVTFKIDTKYLGKIQFLLQTACKIGRCETDGYLSD
ncbi:hypothetical protein BJ741DRAFT_244634 [Chytriomyces cf. hyalinus JEL632]|nr:hypothetical protein BJ741DRAFT_244634 [Chytriomyces cf. hyalinus JEL632]